MYRSLRPMAATAVAVLMLVAAVALAWMVITSGILSASSAEAGPSNPANPAGVEVAPGAWERRARRHGTPSLHGMRDVGRGGPTHTG